MGPPRQQGDVHVGQRRAGQHAPVLPFQHVGQDQPLPVDGQVVLRALGGHGDPAAPRPRGQKEVDLRVMAEGLVMAGPLHGVPDGFPVQHAPLREADLQAEAVLELAGQHFQLHLAHDLHLDAPQLGQPHHVELGVLLFQLAEAGQGPVLVLPRGQGDPVGKHGGKGLAHVLPAAAQPLPGVGPLRPGDGAEGPGGDLVRRLKARA